MNLDEVQSKNILFIYYYSHALYIYIISVKLPVMKHMLNIETNLLVTCNVVS